MIYLQRFYDPSLVYRRKGNPLYEWRTCLVCSMCVFTIRDHTATCLRRLEFEESEYWGRQGGGS